MPENTMTVVIRADDSKFGPAMKAIEAAASRTGASIQKDFTKAATQGTDKMTASMQNMLKGAVGLSALYEVKNAFSSIMDAGLESEKASAKLNATWMATGRGADISTDAVKRQASEFQHLTGIDDELYISSEAILAIYDNIATKSFPRVMTAASDLSVLLGTDLTDSTRQLAFALNDPVDGLTRLKRAGIQFSDSQVNTIKKMMEMNDIASAQDFILSGLEDRIGGVAKVMGESAVGSIEKGKKAWQDLEEAIAGVILQSDTFKETSSFWTDFFEKLSQGTVTGDKKLLDMSIWAKSAGIEPKKAWTGRTLTLDMGGGLKVPEYDQTAWTKYEKHLKDVKIGADAASEGMSILMDYLSPKIFEEPPSPKYLEWLKSYKELTLGAYSPGRTAIIGGYYQPPEINLGGISTPSKSGFNPPKTELPNFGLGSSDYFTQQAKNYADDLSAQADHDKKLQELTYDTGKAKIESETENWEQKKKLLLYQFDYEYGQLGESNDLRIEGEKRLNYELLSLDRDRLDEMKQKSLQFSSYWADSMVSLYESSDKTFGGILANFEKMIEQMMLKSALTGLINFITGGTGGFAAGFMSVLEGRASGGPVSPGHLYQVEERGGMELFRPSVGGQIIPLPRAAESFKMPILQFPRMAALKPSAPSISTSTSSADNSTWHLHFYNTPQERRAMSAMSDRQFAEKFMQLHRGGLIKIDK